MATLQKAHKVIGRRLIFRNADESDAEFIYQLRHDPELNRFLSPAAALLDEQRSWLSRYADDPTQAYFVIETQDAQALGTVRLYDARGDSFCWGSWILRQGAPSHAAIESALMVYHYARGLGFRAAHFQVDKANVPVWRFHENFGAEKVAEDDKQYFYTIGDDAIKVSLLRYRKYLPGRVEVICQGG